MIYWQDFLIDFTTGPILRLEETQGEEGLRRVRTQRNNPTGKPEIKEDNSVSLIQETGQEKRPARMVGSSSLDFKTRPCGMDAAGPCRDSFDKSEVEPITRVRA